MPTWRSPLLLFILRAALPAGRRAHGRKAVEEACVIPFPGRHGAGSDQSYSPLAPERYRRLGTKVRETPGDRSRPVWYAPMEPGGITTSGNRYAVVRVSLNTGLVSCTDR